MSTSQRLRRILQSYETTALSLSSVTRPRTATEHDDTNHNDDEEDDTGTAMNQGDGRCTRPLTAAGSTILLDAIERMKKKRKYEDQQLQQSVVAVQQNDDQYSITTAAAVSTLTSPPVAVAVASDDTVTKRIITNNIDIDNNNRNDIVQSIQELRSVYLYGLQTVSKLQDLRDAPDAILPGNFCSTTRRT